jgi:nickel-dependent lactate racemase
MKVHLQYGEQGLDVEIPGSRVSVLSPAFVPGLEDEANAFREAVREPIGTRPLAEIVAAHERVAVVIPDGTRALPSDRLLPWLFAELSHVPDENITIVVGTGSHRENSPAELERMLGAGVLARYRVVNHSAHDPSTLELAGVVQGEKRVLMNREYVRADRRIVLGFIEPHLMAGFSGGYKGVFPAVADIAAITHYHRAQVIADPRTTWGLLEGNPTQAQIREGGSLLPVDFLINVTLNSRREITRFFCGHPVQAHEPGCAFAKQTAMVACEKRFPIVVTTNSGYPLDQNLYQAVKGMSAAAQIVEDGGTILTAARCNDGFPEHGNFKSLLFEHASPGAVLSTVLAPGFSLFDQWQAQILAMIAARARIALYSELAAEDVRRAHLEPVSDVTTRLQEGLAQYGKDAAIAVLPEGPLTIPFVA